MVINMYLMFTGHAEDCLGERDVGICCLIGLLEESLCMELH